MVKGYEIYPKFFGQCVQLLKAVTSYQKVEINKINGICLQYPQAVFSLKTVRTIFKKIYVF